jgi:CubicO group peptidase (beta-lactamase class C family)
MFRELPWPSSAKERLKGPKPPAWTNVTVRHLPTHTSGIKSYTSLPTFAKTRRKDYEPDELIGFGDGRALGF